MLKFVKDSAEFKVLSKCRGVFIFFSVLGT
jgi:hypothetical protein